MPKLFNVSDNLSNISEESIKANTYTMLKEILEYITKDDKKIARKAKKESQSKIITDEVDSELMNHPWYFKKIFGSVLNDLSSDIDLNKHLCYKNKAGALRVIDIDLLKELLHEYNIVFTIQEKTSVLYEVFVNRRETRRLMGDTPNSFDEDIGMKM